MAGTELGQPASCETRQWTRPRRRRRVVALTLATLLAGSFLLSVIRPVKAADQGVRELGTLVPIPDTLATPFDGPVPNVPPPMIVDQEHGLGFVIGVART